MAELGQQTVEFSSLVSRAAEESFLSLRELVEKSKSSDLSDSEKKINLLKYIVKTQQRMLRLNVLAKWCQQVPLIQYCQQLQSTLSSHETCFTQAADSLFFMHEGLQQARAPMYDVPSAIEVLLTGSYQRLPKCVEDVGMQSSLNEVQQKPALQKLDTLVRSKLLEVSIPKEISNVKVSNGTALLHVDSEFEVLVTLGYRGHLSLWRILHIDLLVGESNGPVKLEESRRLALGDDLERRMAAAENPFTTLYSVLHEFCVALVMDTVIRQVHTLRQGRWRDSIKFELISDTSTGQGNTGSSQTTQDGELDSSAQRTPGVKMTYWLELEKSSNSSDLGLCPFIKIEPGSDLHIKCIHSSFVIDPSSGKEAELLLEQSCIDVEKLLLKAICCNRFTRLLEIQKELMKNSQICQAPGDVALHCCMEDTGHDLQKKDEKPSGEESEGQEVLHVRAYGSSFFILGINIRNGRFLLQSSRNIIAPSILLESAEALNQGSLSAADVFVSLRSRSILQLFASIGKFMGLQVFEDGFPTVKVPKDILDGSNYLIMGFPEYGGSYFLLMQPDKDFKPLFKLIETQSQHSGKSDILNISRAKKIDIAQMQIVEDEMHLNLLDWGKMAKCLDVTGGPNQSSDHGMLLDIGLETSVQPSACTTSSFSSLVDDVFGLEKGTSGHNTFPSLNASQTSPYSLVSTSHHGINPGFSSIKRDGNLQPSSHINSVTRAFGSGSNYNGSMFPVNFKNQNSHSSVGSLSTLKGMSSAGHTIHQSKSEQDLASLRSPLSVEVSSLRALDEDHLALLNGTSREAGSWGLSSRLLSQSRRIGSQVSLLNGKSSTLRNSLNGTYAGSSKSPTSSSMAATPVSQSEESLADPNAGTVVAAKQATSSRKRSVSEMMDMLPSLRGLDVDNSLYKRRKSSKSDQQSTCDARVSLEQVCKRGRYSYGDLVAEANKGNAPPVTYSAVLLNVFRHCSLCIKHARLTSQMDMLDIPYVEEVGQGHGFSNIWFRLPSAGGASWPHICLRLGRPGSLYWDVKINDQHFWDLWELQKGGSSTIWGNGVRIANTTDLDSHIHYDSEGVVLCYQSVEDDSVKKLVADIRRLSNARTFALGMRKLLVVEPEERVEEEAENTDGKTINAAKGPDGNEKYTEQMRKAFKIEAVGLMSLWFSFGSGVLARFVVEWESGKEGCTMHVSPDGLWPHTKFLEEFINGGEVASLLDCIRLTAGPLHALAAATRPARAGQTTVIPGMAAPAFPSVSKQNMYSPSQPISQNIPLSNASQVISAGSHGIHSAGLLAAAAAAGRGSSGIVPSSLLPIDVSVVLRSPYWIRIVYRKNFAVDMRCFAGDQVWLQPATPPKGGPSVGGSLPCPQFRPFIMEHVAQELNGLEPNFTGLMNPNNPISTSNGGRASLPLSSGFPRPGSQISGVARVANALATSPNLASMGSMLPLRRSPGVGVPAHVRGELNTAIIGLGDDGGYGGGWVPLVALKKVLRGILKYLGVLWLFAQLPDLLKEILGSILKDNEGALLNLDQEQPALRFFVGGYVFAVSVHRVQLLLQVLSVKRFHHQQQNQQQNSAAAQEELTQPEITEICDYFSRRVASEPYDASRVASFITLLTLPISVLREFLKLITWKKNMLQSQGGETAPTQKPRIELCLENHCGLNMDGNSGNLSATKSNVHYDRAHSTVDFGLTVVLDSAHVPHVNAAGGAAWLPYCVSVRLRYTFGENPSVSFLGMEGSHGGRACWFRVEEWEKCKQRVARTLEVHGFASGGGDVSQGRLKLVADGVQKTLHLCLQGLKDGNGVTAAS